MIRSNSTLRLVASILAAGLAGTLASASGAPAPPAHPAPVSTPHRISGPYTHANLTVFLIHGRGAGLGQEFLTLQEAMEQKLVVVHETGDVNELSVENLSPRLAIFIHAGDIVKGGRQDRTIPQDVLLPPKSGVVPLSSFCVEHGRWSQRGQEPAAAFNSSTDIVAGSEIKIAARKAADQGRVWQQVSRAQEALSAAAGNPVTAAESPSSLQLTLQNPQVQKTADRYIEALAAVGSREPSAIGCAFAVNGSIRSAEIYASPELFRKMWRKLLKSAAVEAMSGPQSTSSTLTAADVRAFLAAADAAAPESRNLSAREKLLTRETDKAVQFETLDRERKDASIHRSYVAK